MGMIEEEKHAPAPVMETSNLYTNLGFNSLGFVRLMLRIEEAYSIVFGLMEMGTCLQVDRLIALVESKVKESGYDSTAINQSERLG